MDGPTSTGGASGAGGIWNWEDLPEDVQLEFQQSYFAASNIIYQGLQSQALGAAQGG